MFYMMEKGDNLNRKRKSDIRQWFQPKEKQEKCESTSMADDESDVSQDISCPTPSSSSSTETPSTFTSAVETPSPGHTNDIGCAVNNRTKLNREEIYKFLNSVWTPEENYQFPVVHEGNRTRKFQRQWLKDFQWLAYSEQQSGAFCKFCVLFASDTAGQGGFQVCCANTQMNQYN